MTTTDEKGQPITSPVTEVSACEWCNAPVSVHAMGRRPRFCSPRCRVRHHRARGRVDRAYAELLRAQEALERGESQT